MLVFLIAPPTAFPCVKSSVSVYFRDSEFRFETLRERLTRHARRARVEEPYARMGEPTSILRSMRITYRSLSEAGIGVFVYAEPPYVVMTIGAGWNVKDPDSVYGENLATLHQAVREEIKWLADERVLRLPQDHLKGLLEWPVRLGTVRWEGDRWVGTPHRGDCSEEGLRLPD